jgi:iron complex transport system substrate-binding protein
VRNIHPILALVCLGFILFQVSCSHNPGTRNSNSVDEPSVTVNNAGRTLTFPDAPNRIVTMNQNGTEMFIALGLEDRMVGTAFKDDPILPRYRDEYENIPVLSEQYPSLEVLLEANPDFVYGFMSAFSPPKGPATVERLKQLGITAYVDRMYYGASGLTLNDVFEEIRTLGRIFRVENRADSLVPTFRKKIRRIRERIPSDGDTLSVAVYDSGKETLYTAGRSLVSDMLRTVGARNVFRDDVNGTWSSLSWEKLVEANPEYIVVMDYGAVTAKEKIKFLKNKSSLQTVRALEENNFVVLPLSTTFVGVRNVQGIRLLAHGFYPNHVKGPPGLANE